MGVLTFLGYLPGLGRSLDFDSAETVGLFIRPGPPWAAFGRQTVFNNHPFFSFLEQLVRVVSGRADAAAMRVLPIAFGAASVGVLAWYCARRFAVVPAIAAGSLVALNPMFSDFSRAVRGYSLLALCALVSSFVVIDELLPTDDRPPAFGRRSRVWYVLAAAVGIATHLFMVLVVLGQVGMLAYARRLDARWRQCLLTVAVLSGLAYMVMARLMLDAQAAHGRALQPRLPLEVAEEILGTGWAAVIAAPVLVVGVALVSRRRVVAAGLVTAAAAFVFIWLVYRSSALTPRYFVFLVPLAALLLAVAVARFPALAVVVGVAAVLASASTVDGFVTDPTSYRQAAQLIRSVDSAGGRSCVAGVGAAAMRAYHDVPTGFAEVTDPAELAPCDVLVVAAWWPGTTAEWYEGDQRVISAAEDQFRYETRLDSKDSALVLSRSPLSRWSVTT